MNPSASTKQCNGQAKSGDRVTYFDIANQDGDVWEVVEETTPNAWGTEYMLVREDLGATQSTDLRAYGWFFAKEVSA